MRTKHLLTAIALPALFAACTAEEITTAENNVKDNLGNRPVVEGVAFSFGDAQSRAEVSGYNTINFAEGDKVGVALIDTYAGSNTNPVYRYNLLTQSINTNYIFTADADGAFSSEAAMVEGNYVFYYPYNTQRTRSQILTDLPKEQALTKMADGKYTSYPSVLAYSEEKGAPIAVAYDFLSAADAGNTLEASMKQIYSTPLFTLENTAVKGGTGEDKDQPVAITIKQIILSKANGASFTVKAPLKFATATQNAYAEANGAANSIVSALFNETIPSAIAASTKQGPWQKSVLSRETGDLLGSTAGITGATTSSITLTLATPVTVPAEGTFSFYAVLPAGDYTTDNLVATVYNGEGKSQDVHFNGVTLTAGQRYPEGEFDANEIVNADVKGVSLSTMVTEQFQLTGQLISTVDELINAIRNAEQNAQLTFRMTGSAVINSRVANLLALESSTKAASIEFLNEVAFDGPSITWKSAHPVTFSADVTVNEGAAVVMNDNNSTFDKIVNNGTINLVKGTISTITNNATLNLNGVNTTATIANNGIVNAQKNGTDVTVDTGSLTNGNNSTKVAATLNVAAGVTLTATVTNEEGATVNNNGTMSSLNNQGTVNNGTAENVSATISNVTANTAATGYTAVINNYGTLTTAVNDHIIKMLDVNAAATVSAGNGTIENQELAYVDAVASNKVTYVVTGSKTEDKLDVTSYTNNAITHLILDGVTLKVNNTKNFLGLELVVKGNVTISSGKGAQAGLLLNNVAKVTINANSKLTVNSGVNFAAGTTVDDSANNAVYDNKNE